MANRYEEAARNRKVRKIVLHIWKGMTPAQKLDVQWPNRLSQCSQSFRDQFAAGAGQNSPSEETWKEVVLGIAGLIKAEHKLVNAGLIPSPRRAS